MSLAEIFDFSVCKKILDVHPLHFDRVVHSGIRCRICLSWSAVASFVEVVWHRNRVFG